MTRLPTLALDHLWQSTLVVGLAWFVCAFVLRKSAARVRFAVWMGASVKFLVPFAVLTDFGRALAPIGLVPPSQSQQIFDTVRMGVALLTPAPLPVTTTPPQAPTAVVEWLVAAAAVCWLIGVVVVAGRVVGRWRAVLALERDATSVGAFDAVPLLVSEQMRDRHIEPGVIGLWRPAILIPSGIDAELTPAQLQCVLAHERQHARRRDNLLATIHAIVQTLIWFYPLVWFVGRRLSEERERACDEAVLASAEPDEYAEGILRVCRFYWQASRSHATGVASADLRARIEQILHNERPQPLNWLRRGVLVVTVAALLVAPALVGWLSAQALAPENNSFVGLATSAEKKFEVATIKQNVSGSAEWSLGPPARGNISIVNLSLASIIAQSFRTNRTMVVGEPGWIGSTNYDIVGKGPDPTVGNPVVWEMMRSLLIDRFHLKYHIEQREMPVFALTVARGGHKLTLGENGRCAEAIKAGSRCGDVRMLPLGVEMQNMPIGALISGIGRRAGRQIVDHTQLTGRYDAIVTWLPDGAKLEDLDLTNVPQEYTPRDMSLTQALEQILGLKLEPQRASTPFLVIDGVSRPDPN